MSKTLLEILRTVIKPLSVVIKRNSNKISTVESNLSDSVRNLKTMSGKVKYMESKLNSTHNLASNAYNRAINSVSTNVIGTNQYNQAIFKNQGLIFRNVTVLNPYWSGLSSNDVIMLVGKDSSGNLNFRFGAANTKGTFKTSINIGSENSICKFAAYETTLKLCAEDGNNNTNPVISIHGDRGRYTTTIGNGRYDYIVINGSLILPSNGGGNNFRLSLDKYGEPTFTDINDSTNKWTPTGGLPKVTSEDAGKFLRVSSSGKWAAESISNAAGVSF